MGTVNFLFGKYAARLVDAAEKHITLVNGKVAVDIKGLKSHLSIETELTYRDTCFKIAARIKENGDPVDVFGQLLLRGVQADRSVEKRLPGFLRASVCELLGFSEHGKITAFFSVDHYWRAALNAGISVEAIVSSHRHTIDLDAPVTLDLPSNVPGAQALLGVQHAFLQGSNEGVFLVNRLGALKVLREQGHPMVSSKAADILERLF